LPETLVPPKQTDLLKRKLEDPKVLQSKALENNPELKAAQLMIEAAELALQSAEKMNMPRIDAIGRAGWHSQVETLYEGRWRADLAVSMPIFDGGLKDAQVDKAKAELNKQRAMRLSLERQTRQAVLETALAIERLKTRQNQVKVAGDFAERYLDKSRTEYQFERKTDLGDSMVRVSRAEYEVLQLQRDRAVLWDSLSKLLGE
jgi:outer membrane protein TolC